MNTWPDELVAEYHRQRILDEIVQIRLEKLAQKSRVDRLHFLRRVMFSLGNWMISLGGQLRDHYGGKGPGDQDIFPTPT